MSFTFFYVQTIPVCRTTIISLLMHRQGTWLPASRLVCSLDCTACTTCVPLTSRLAGTAETHSRSTMPAKTTSLYRMYQYFLGDNSNRPWTIVIDFRFNIHNQWYIWYRYASKPYAERLLSCTTTNTVLVQFSINLRYIKHLALYRYFQTSGTGMTPPSSLIHGYCVRWVLV